MEREVQEEGRGRETEKTAGREGRGDEEIGRGGVREGDGEKEKEKREREREKEKR